MSDMRGETDMTAGAGGPDVGDYPAILTGIARRTSKDGAEFRVWTFTITGDVSPGPITASSSLAMGPKSKSYAWATALLGRKPEKGENVAGMIIGKRCRLVIGIGDDDWPKITHVLPVQAQPEPQKDAEAVGVSTAPNAVPAVAPEVPDDLPF